MKTFLHVGCGRKTKKQTNREFEKPLWKEIRLDIDPAAQPDILGSTTDLSAVKGISIDAIFSSHNIEHVFAHEVPVALSEYIRVLQDDGFLVLTCPDLQSVCELVAKDKLADTVYESPSGPITPLDILYGHSASIALGNVFMAHKSGFTQKTLSDYMVKAGFKTVTTRRRGHPFYDLWVIATKAQVNEFEARELAKRHFPQ